MNNVLAILVLATAFVDAAVEKDDVRIVSEIEGQLFQWEVVNESATPISRVRFYTHQCYNHEIPEGWEFTYADNWFEAWTPQVRRAIRPGDSAVFGARGSSGGAVLGTAEATISFRGDKPPVVFDRVWSPVPKPSLLSLGAAGLIVLLATLHTAFLVGRRRRSG